ncbi:MAG: two-component regulator propeller domain-containing protein, partial [Bacteroidota bacterium]
MPLELQGKFFNKTVHVVFEDSLGYLWIGTNSGLYRYDGNHLKRYQYDVFDEHSIPNNTVIAITEDQYQNLWIGNESYLVHFDRLNEHFKGYFKNQTIEELYTNQKGEVWANPRKSGLIKITSSEQRADFQFDLVYPYDTTQNSLRIAVAEDDFGQMIAVSKNGLMVLDASGSWRPTNLNFPIEKIQKGKNQTFWLTSGNRIMQVQYEKDQFFYEIIQQFELPSKAPDFVITNLLLSQKSQIWIGTNYGLFQLDIGAKQPTIVKIIDRRGVLNNQISSLTIDQYQNLWVGTWKGLVKYIDRASMFQYLDLKRFGMQMENDKVSA